MTLRYYAAAAAALALAPVSSAQEISGWTEEPYAGTHSLSSGFSDDPYRIEVTAGGTMANPVEGAGCTGYIGTRPDVVLNYDAGSTFDLTISAASETDVNLVVRAPDGRYFCDDDGGEGLNPLLTVTDPPAGRYRIWAGVYAASSDYVDAVVGFSELGEAVTVGSSGPVASNPSGSGTSGSGTIRAVSSSGNSTAIRAAESGPSPASGSVSEWRGEPYFGTTVLSSGFSGDPRLVDIEAGGSRRNPLSGAGCTGYIGTRPDAVLRYTAGSLGLTLSAAASEDLSLVVRTPGGRYYCDDDSGEGLNPRLDFPTPESGSYQIWVGTYSDTDTLISSRLAISELGIEAE